MTVIRGPLDGTVGPQGQATEQRKTTRPWTWGRRGSKEQCPRRCTMTSRTTRNSQSEPPVIGRDNEPLRHVRKSAAAGCGGPEPPQHVDRRALRASSQGHRDTNAVATDRESDRGEGQLLACQWCAGHRGRLRGCPRRCRGERLDPGSGRRPDNALPLEEVETFWVSARCGGTRRFVDCNCAVRFVHSPVYDRTKKNGFRCGCSGHADVAPRVSREVLVSPAPSGTRREVPYR